MNDERGPSSADLMNAIVALRDFTEHGLGTVISKIDVVDAKLGARIDRVDAKIAGLDMSLNGRIDRLQHDMNRRFDRVDNLESNPAP